MRDKVLWRVAAGIVGVVVAAAVGTGLWYLVALQPLDRSGTNTIYYTLKPGTRVATVASQLQQQGVIRSATAFTWYVTATRLRRELEAGTYSFHPSSSIPQIAAMIAHGKVAQNSLVIPEGSTVTQIRAAAAKKGITVAAFNAALGDSYTSAALAGRPAGDSSLEGYLFPNTYEIKQPPNAHQLIQAMLDNFSKQVTASNLTPAFAAEGLSLHQGVTLASIVEKEESNPPDQALVAQVFLNRIKAGMPLQSDVTVDYASQLTGLPFSTTLDSPYNTYTNKGLPPGPICNPGLSALGAVAHPTPNNYLYFVADMNGTTHYATTFAQQQQNIQTYLNQ